MEITLYGNVEYLCKSFLHQNLVLLEIHINLNEIQYVGTQDF